MPRNDGHRNPRQLGLRSNTESSHLLFPRTPVSCADIERKDRLRSIFRDRRTGLRPCESIGRRGIGYGGGERADLAR
jgi:hypothetical protein